MYKVFLSFLLFVSCQWQDKKAESILLIAVENFSSESLLCNEEQRERAKGFSDLCQDAVRFSHVFTPSPLSQASLASILTAKYPYEHGLWHNGSRYLKENWETFAETAVEKGYRTAFFSGGSSIWRKSGLSQGFEWFDDNVGVDLGYYYRPVAQNFSRFVRWLDLEVQNDPFVSILYIPDLQFEQSETFTDTGLKRERNIEGQFQELDESLSSLFSELKKRGRWNNTYIILFGLNGQTKSYRQKELNPINLHSENVQVAFFAKPPRKPRDLGLNWKVDHNYSLVDLGYSIFRFLGKEMQKKDYLPRKSIFQALEEKDNSIHKWNRSILVESAWGQRHGLSNTRLSIRNGHFLYLHQESAVYFNTLIDRLETTPIVWKEENPFSITEGLLQAVQVAFWQPIADDEIAKWQLSSQLFSIYRDEYILSFLEELADQRLDDQQLQNWRAKFALQNRDWKSLLMTGLKNKNDNWVYVARKNRKKGKVQELQLQPCLRLFAKDHFRSQQAKRDESTPPKCEDEMSLSLFQWVERKGKERERARETFIRHYIKHSLDQEILGHNYRLGMIWDISKQIQDKPHAVDLVLSLPEYSRYRKIVSTRMEFHQANRLQ